MLTCEEALKQLYAFLDGALVQPEARGVEEHLQKCRECFGHFELERLLKEHVRLKASVEPPPPGLVERARALLDKLGGAT